MNAERKIYKLVFSERGMKKEMNNRILLIILSSLILISLFSSVANAADVPVNALDAGKTIGSTLTNFIKGLGQGFSGAAGELFTDNAWATRLLLAVLLYMVLYSIITVIFRGGRIITPVITLIITLLTFIALPGDFLQALALQYGAMGAAILTVIPFAIMLVFTVRLQSLLAGRVLWIFYCIYYLGLYFYGIVSNAPGMINGSYSSYFYLLFFLGGLIMFFVIGPVKRAIFKGKLGDIKESGRRIASKGKLLHQLQDTELTQSYGQDTGI
jgi:hypothetical protein